MGKATHREYNIPQGHLKAKLVSMEVDNPSFNPSDREQNGNRKRADAYINVNESPITRMYSRGQLDDFELMVANRYRKIYEGVIGSGSSEVKERVDCVGYADPTFKNMEASEEYKNVQRHLGMTRGKIMDLVCGEGQTITVASKVVRGRLSTVRGEFRECLVLCGELWDLKKTDT